LPSAETLLPKEPGSRPPSPVVSSPAAGQSQAGPPAAADSSVVVCPQCAAILNVRAGLLGKRVKCKKCTTVFVASADSGAPRAGEVPAPREVISRAETVPPGTRSAPPITDLPTQIPAGPPGVQRPASSQSPEHLPVFEPEPGAVDPPSS